jgi:hypothetical protein
MALEKGKLRKFLPQNHQLKDPAFATRLNDQVVNPVGEMGRVQGQVVIPSGFVGEVRLPNLPKGRGEQLDLDLTADT